MAANTKNKPRISINKLAEYSVSRAARQRQILKDQKYPQDFKGTYYKESMESISRCLSSNLEDLEIIERQISILEQANPQGVGTQRRISSNIDALEAFRMMLDDIDLKGAEPSLGDHAPQKLTIHNVDVSVRPDILLRSKGRSKQSLIGAIKLHFPKAYSLDEYAAGLVSAVLQSWIDRFMHSDGVASGPGCYVIDVGNRTVWHGVRSTAARMRDIESNCENIAALWPSI